MTDIVDQQWTDTDVDTSRDGGGGLSATGLLCGSCGAQSSPTAKFCGECATRLTENTQSAEYKQVTVLFADVVRLMGEQVGMAQRMESLAPPGGVMLSESTARLVEHIVTLGEPERVHIKADEPVPVRRRAPVQVQCVVSGHTNSVSQRHRNRVPHPGGHLEPVHFSFHSRWVEEIQARRISEEHSLKGQANGTSRSGPPMGGLKRHGGRSAEYDRLFGYENWRWRQLDVGLGWNRLGNHLALRQLRHCWPPFRQCFA
jgi:hypothetical protein